ncbi:MAG: ribosome recycling factor [Calditrichia bacterium]
MGIKSLKKDTETRMEKSIEHFQHEISTIRTGRATPSLLDIVKVDYYGQKMPINQLASVSAPEPRMLVVQPWDKNAIQPIEKAIQESDLGLNPSNDGNLIRIPIPELSSERRQNLVKTVKKLAEETRVAIRNIRRDTNDTLKKMQKNHEISEDEMHLAIDEVQKLTDSYIEKVDELLKHKESEILED